MADGTFQITGTVILDAQGDPDGVFVFKMASTLITASDSNVSIINSARFCRIFWGVGSSATLGSNSNFVGHILAMTSITANTGAHIQGQLLARNGAVTLSSNTITNGLCETVAELSPAPTTPPAPTSVPAPLPTSAPAPTSTPVPSSTPVPTSTPTPSLTPVPSSIPMVTDVPVPTVSAPITTVVPTPILTPALTPTPIPVITTTVTGGELPETGSQSYNVLFAGFVFTLGGLILLKTMKH